MQTAYIGIISSQIILFPKKYATIVREFKDDYMKVNYPERIDATARELKIILGFSLLSMLN